MICRNVNVFNLSVGILHRATTSSLFDLELLYPIKFYLLFYLPVDFSKFYNAMFIYLIHLGMFREDSCKVSAYFIIKICATCTYLPT